MTTWITRMLALALVSMVSMTGWWGTASAEGGFKVGLLKCDTAGGTNFIIGSSTNLNCVFSPAEGNRISYRGEINTYGIDLSYKKSGVMIWAVIAPSRNVAPGALNGGYVGAKGSASVGVGVGANVLVGGGNNSISLQPLSLEGLKGLNIAAGVVKMTLKMTR